MNPTDILQFQHADLTKLEPENLERRTGDLIREYARCPSQPLAQSVVRHIDALCLHPDFGGDPEQRCAYRRLSRHWGWLATRRMAAASPARGPEPATDLLRAAEPPTPPLDLEGTHP